MKRLSLFFAGALLVAIVSLLPVPARAAEDKRRLVWEEYNVTVSNIDTTNNRFHVQETHKLRVIVGVFNGGDRKIPLSRAVSIENIRVTDGGQELESRNQSSKSCGYDRGIVCLSVEGGQQVIYYNFVSAGFDNTVHTIVYDYDVVGALRSYPDGDWFDWKLMAEKRPFPVQSATMTLQLPRDLKVDTLATYPGDWTQSKSGSTLVYQSPGSVSSGFEIEFKYPHNAAMPPPPWQAGYDRGYAIAPIGNLIFLVLGGLVAILGPFWVFTRYAAHKRGIGPIVVPEYLTEPPSDIPASIAGTLIDGSADTKDVMSSLIDLARRGYIVIEQREDPGLLGIGKQQHFSFHRTDKPTDGLRFYERTMLTGLFAGTTRDDTDLNQLKNVFYKTVNTVKEQLYGEVVRLGYYKKSPNAVRGGWIGGGVGFIAIAVVAAVAYFAQDELPPYLALALLPFAGLAFTGTVMALVSGAMASRTALGEQEAAKWKAFRQYLKNIKKYTTLEEAASKFEQYLPYAVTFGLEKEYISEFSRVLTSFPHWYYYGPVYGPWSSHYGRGYSSGSGGSWADFGGSGGGLNQMSSNLSSGLVAMSGGLTTLLNTASSVMTSQPSSSSGGHGGGGGGGGGSAGFH
jgi:hypothetical protein